MARRRSSVWGLLAAVVLFVTGCGDASDEPAVDADPVVRYEVVVVNRYSHDEGAYTQGLEFVDGQLLESTGRIGTSSIRLVDPVTGTVLEQQPLAGSLYGEGATLVGDEIWQLTYQSETVLVHRLDGLVEERRYDYEGEGWGLCYTGTRLLMSNGSSELAVRDVESFAEVGSIPVTLDGEPVTKLNELECVGEMVWANIYQSNEIVAISSSSGNVLGVADLSALVPDGFEGSNNFVLNGIAYNQDTGRFWVTGKEWPVMYEIELIPTS